MPALGRVAVVGGSGYIGSHLVALGRSGEMDIAPVSAEHVSGQVAGSVSAAVHAWQRNNAGAFKELCLALKPFDVVINAAGLARAGSTDKSALFGANTVLAALVAQAAHAGGVRRLVHISSAAVQGRLDPLDESTRQYPSSPYAMSKAAAESFLLEVGREDIPPEVIVYRPTSVQGVGQRPTDLLRRFVARLPFMLVAGSGDQHVPVALIQNVAAGILFAANMPVAPRIILQPSERITAIEFLRLFGARRIVHLPPHLSDLTLDMLHRLTRTSPLVTSHLRWLDLLLEGQEVQADTLRSAGFLPPAGRADWVELVRRHDSPPRHSRPSTESDAPQIHRR